MADPLSTLPPPLPRNMYDLPPRPGGEDPTRNIAQPTHLPATHGPSLQLQDLCQRISNSKSASPTTSRLSRDRFRSPLERTLKNAIGSPDVKELSGNTASLFQTLKDHKGLVIVLGPHGLPEFVFERVNGQWQGYTGIAFAPLPPGRSTPLEVLESLRGNFTAYALGGWKPRVDAPIVVQPHFDKRSNDTAHYSVTDDTRHRDNNSDSSSDADHRSLRPPIGRNGDGISLHSPIQGPTAHVVEVGTQDSHA